MRWTIPTTTTTTVCFFFLLTVSTTRAQRNGLGNGLGNSLGGSSGLSQFFGEAPPGLGGGEEPLPGSEGDVCRDCDCYVCTGDTVDDLNRRIVTISTESCKSSSAISWQCCLGSTGGSGVSSCDVTSECNTAPEQKCEGVLSFDVSVPLDATGVVIQGHDGKFIGNDPIETATCGGSNNGKGGSSCDGNGVCTKTVDISEGKCGGNGGSMGDPHFLTWGQEWFDFMGVCDLVLVDAPDFGQGAGFTAHVRTKDLYQFSYIQTAAIKIGDDVLEVSSHGNYRLNGVADAIMPNILSEYLVTYHMHGDYDHVFDIQIGESDHVIVKSHKELVNIKFSNVHAHDFEGSVGLMGQWQTGTRYARDGSTVMDDDDIFGQEWQVRDADPQIFSTESPTQGGSCKMPSPKSMQQRRLGESISKEAAEVACAHVEGAFDQCVYDVIATGDLTFPGAF